MTLGMSTVHTVETAPARPALGFALDGTTLADVHAWARRSNVDCDDVRPGYVTCANVPPRALGRADVEKPIDELALAFDAHGRLVNVTTLRSHLYVADVTAMNVPTAGLALREHYMSAND